MCHPTIKTCSSTMTDSSILNHPFQSATGEMSNLTAPFSRNPTAPSPSQITVCRINTRGLLSLQRIRYMARINFHMLFRPSMSCLLGISSQVWTKPRYIMTDRFPNRLLSLRPRLRRKDDRCFRFRARRWIPLWLSRYRVISRRRTSMPLGSVNWWSTRPESVRRVMELKRGGY